jgi:hypothetical protein
MPKVFYAVLSLCLFAATAFAQTSRGTVSGTVTDPTGAVIAGAHTGHVCAIEGGNLR